jgi:diadenosine tetraphosphate (Ap4A) HIT family hydrolase
MNSYFSEGGFTLHPQLAKDSIELMDLPLCKLLLINDENFPWFVLVPRIIGVEEIFQLDWQQQQQMLNESSLVSELLMQVFSGDKLNIAALGNVVPQLHIHHVVRYKNDLCWPKPIWGLLPAKPYSSDKVTLLKAKLLPLLQKIIEKNKA